MDPNLFAVDGARLLEVLLLIVVLAFIVERALALFFESRPLASRIADTGVKEIVAFLVSFGICVHWDFDALSVLMPKASTQLLGEAVTGAVVAGGSKAAVKLFHDVMGVMSTAEKERKEQKAAKASP